MTKEEFSYIRHILEKTPLSREVVGKILIDLVEKFGFCEVKYYTTYPWQTTGNPNPSSFTYTVSSDTIHKAN